MAFELLTKNKKKTSEIPIENKNNIFINQDLFLNPFLSKYEIKKYLLLIRKSSEFEIASYSGFLAKEMMVCSFTDDSLFINHLTERNDITSRQAVLDYYNESVLLPKEYNLHIKNEMRIWKDLEIDYFIPVFDQKQKLFAVMLCRGAYSNITKNDNSLFVDRIYYWAKTYYDMHVDNESKRSLELYKQFNDFICEISLSEDQEEISGKILEYFISLHKSTRGIFFSLSRGYYIPVKHKNVDALKSYSKTAMDIYKKDTVINVHNNSQLGSEMGMGQVKIIIINSKNILMLNSIFPVKLDEKQYAALKNVSRRFLECAQKKL